MAQLAAVESMTATVGPTLPSLFEPAPAEVQRAFGRFSGGDRFSALAREFFARLTSAASSTIISDATIGSAMIGRAPNSTVPLISIAEKHRGSSKRLLAGGTARTSTNVMA
jgi:hypothetical protein